MKNLLSYLSPMAFGIALAAGAPTAQAQTAVVAPLPATTVVAQDSVVTVPAPVETVETVRTVQTTTIPRRRIVRRSDDRVITTRTTVSQRIVPAMTQPIYDVATPDSVVGATAVVPAYRYVYQPDRILVIDPYTNIAVQAIPR